MFTGFTRRLKIGLYSSSASLLNNFIIAPCTNPIQRYEPSSKEQFPLDSFLPFRCDYIPGQLRPASAAADQCQLADDHHGRLGSALPGLAILPERALAFPA